MRKGKPIEGGVLSPDVRMSDDDHPGVVASGDGWRIAVTLDGRWFRVQTPAQYPDGPGWQSLPGRAGDLCKQVERVADLFPDLREAAARLPERPTDAAPDFVDAARELRRLYEVTAFEADDHPGEIARHGNWRVIVGPDRDVYIAQRVAVFDAYLAARAGVSVGGFWHHVATARTLRRLAEKSADPEPLPWEDGEREDADRCEAARAALFGQVAKMAPDRAAEGQWAWMPQRPKSGRKGSARSAPESRESGGSAG